MSNTTPRLSIGLPVYNGEKYLSIALDCILNQSFTNFELIISDNASTDSTEEICRSYALKDARVRYYRNEKNIGAGWNFNRVFELSRSEYFKWICADDTHEPTFLEKCITILDNDFSVVLSYTDSIFIDADGKEMPLPVPSWDLQMESIRERLSFIIYATCKYRVNVIFGIIRSKALKKTDLMGHFLGQDYRLIGQLSIQGKFYEVPEKLFLRRLHSGASANQGFKFYNPFGKGSAFLSFCRLTTGHLQTIFHSATKFSDKIFLIFSLMRFVFRETSCCIIENLRKIKKLVFQKPKGVKN